MKRKSVRYLIGILLTALALWLSFKNLDWTELKRSIAGVDYFWVGLAVVNVLFTVYAMGWRWRILMRSRQEMSMGYMFQLNVISQYLNIVIPGRFGELLKAWLPAKRYGISGSYILGTVVIEKMFDFFAFVVLWVSVPAFFAFRDKLKGYTLALVICVILLIILVLVIWKRDMVRRWITRFSSILPEKLKQRVVNFMERGMESFSQLKDFHTTLTLAVFTVMIIVLSTTTNFLLFLAFGFQLSFFKAMVLLLVVLAGSTPPSVPGRVGIFEYMVILGLSLFGIAKADAMGYAVVLHVVAYLPKIILGFVFMANMNLSLKDAESELAQIQDKDRDNNEEDPS